jgi:hypothetical protein
MGYENMNQAAQVGLTGIEPLHYVGKFFYHLSHCRRLVEFPKALVINARHLVLAEL